MAFSAWTEWQTEWFNPNLVDALRLPPKPGVYDVYMQFGPE